MAKGLTSQPLRDEGAMLQEIQAHGDLQSLPSFAFEETNTLGQRLSGQLYEGLATPPLAIPSGLTEASLTILKYILII